MSEKVVCFIGHVESASDERKINYQILSDRMSKNFTMLDFKSTLLKSKEDLLNFKEQYPNFNIQQVVHDSLKVDGGYLTNDYGIVKDAVFPRWPGEIGLLFSLYNGFKKFLETDYPYLLWLEDDISIDTFFEQNFSIYLNNVPQHFDFICLSVRDDQRWIYEQYKDTFEINNEAFCKIFELYWAGAILISKEGAKKYIEYFENEVQAYPWDWLIFNVRSDNHYTNKFSTYSLKANLPDLFKLNYDISPDSTIYIKDELTL